MSCNCIESIKNELKQKFSEKEKVNMSYSYCPFCGEKYKK